MQSRLIGPAAQMSCLPPDDALPGLASCAHSQVPYVSKGTPLSGPQRLCQPGFRHEWPSEGRVARS